MMTDPQNRADGPVQPAHAPENPFTRVPEDLRTALEARGFTTLTEVQEAALAPEVGGRDLQISSQTGSGKTVALGFAVADLLETPGEVGPVVLIMVPTRELAAQVCRELHWLFAGLDGVRVGSLAGGSPMFRDRQLLGRRPRVIVGTPGRLADHLRSGTLNLGSIRALVLDEADQMLDLGFREELEAILEATPDTRRTHLVSATFPQEIQGLAERYQDDPVVIEGTARGLANEDIEHHGHVVLQRERYAALVNLLLLRGDEKTLIFVERRSDTAEVATRLEDDGFAAQPLSGEMAQSQRDRTLAAFRSGRVTVLVATDVAARGLDVPDITTVIHTSPPIDAEVYTHRSGRTGRAGRRGHSILLAAPNRRWRVNKLLDRAGVSMTWGPVPSAGEVRAHLDERERMARSAALEEALAADASDTWMEEARSLLSSHEPERVVAALLKGLSPTRAVEPMEVGPPPGQRPAVQHENKHGRARSREERRAQFDRGDSEPRGRQDSGRGRQDSGRGRQDSGNGRQDSGNGEMRPYQRRRPHPAERGGHRDQGDMVRFFVNWGANQGVNPRRLLAALCRRGRVTGRDIGSIAIHPNASTFDVRAEVAESFEQHASRPDARDPRTRIRRDRAAGERPAYGRRPQARTSGS